jgi:hypothetical protein
MYPSLITTVSADRVREWREQAATDRLVIQARRARRARRQAAVREADRRPWSKWWTRRTVTQLSPADATPDQWASALCVAAAQRADTDDRQPVGGRAS